MIKMAAAVLLKAPSKKVQVLIASLPYAGHAAKRVSGICLKICTMHTAGIYPSQ